MNMEDKMLIDDFELEDKTLKYAKCEDQDYKLVHIDLVKTGLDCKCVCPRCFSPVVAKNSGKKYEHFFSHLPGADCVGAHESVMHILAKEILEEEKCIYLPKHNRFLTGQLKFDRVEVEFHNKQTNLRPDCACYYGDKVLWVEFKRTHEVDKHKADKIASKGIECIEIDINKIAEDKDKLKEYLTNKPDNRRWIYNKQMTAYESNYVPERKRKQSSLLITTSFDHCIFAIDETGRLCCLKNKGDVDFNEHQYYCPACKKELTLRVYDNEYLVFEHVEKDTICNWEVYLHHSAQLAAFQYFNTNAQFFVYANNERKCSKYYQCPLKGSMCQKITPQKRIDVKAFGYDLCEQDVLENEEEKFNANLVISKSSNSNHRFIINFKAGEYSEVIPEGISSYINVNVTTENVVYNIMRFGIWWNYVEGGNISIVEDTPSSELKHHVNRFILHNSGKYYFAKDVDCEAIFEKKKPTTQTEFYIKENIDQNATSIKPILVQHSIENGYKVIKCETCKNFSHSNGVCMRYKKDNTPKNPLKEDYFECNSYSLDSEIHGKHYNFTARKGIIEK